MSLAHEHLLPGGQRPARPRPAPVWNPEPFEESDASFRTLVESIADYGIFMLDVSGNVASWNGGAERIKGYAAHEIIGRSHALFFTPEDVTRRRPQRLLETATAMGRVEDEGWRVRKDGSRFWANVVITVIRSRHGELRGYAEVARDITERKQAEQTRDRHRQELQDFIDSMSTFNAKVALDGTFLLVNKAAQFAAGLPWEQLMRTNFLEGHWFAYDPQVQARVKEVFARACTGEVINYDERISALGRLLDINFSLVPVKSADGKVGYIVAEGRDISLLKAAEAALRQRTTELESTNRELESFSYSVSHDLRAPLRSIDGFTQALMDDHAAALNPEAANYLARVRGASERMGQLIDALLKLSQLARTELHFTTVDLSDIQPGLRARGDTQLLRIVLVNLLGNAWKFTRHTAAPHIEFTQIDRADPPAFCIRDNGAGFNPTYADRLFGPFQRLHDQAEYEGTGIGLATVQRIIARHGGVIRAESQPNAGAAFCFTLPRLTQP
jgi:PAS domain S-box-containing protein